MHTNDVGAALALASVVRELPPEDLESLAVAAGCAQVRTRALPAWLTMYVVLAMALLPGAPYADAVGLVWRVVPRLARRRTRPDPPTPAAVARARSRLGVEPLRVLAERFEAELVMAAAPPEVLVIERPTRGSMVDHRVAVVVHAAAWWLRTVKGDLLAVGLDDSRLEAAVRAYGRGHAPQLWLRHVVAAARPGDAAELATMVPEVRASFPDLVVRATGSRLGHPLRVTSRDPALVAQEFYGRACVEFLLSTQVQKGNVNS